ncbi:sodium-dependent transporter [Slackia faecicanis]|uniref:Transporter n=1 Tax=Slackia faecicanis TaxID=255723 RepID=A0A3N0ADN7_9ACTN|nr:sodium-dependent transporter [Slackia faecicanis]RNL18854.1 sodium-dependent transporter [Slackia faecicanis]
MSEPQPSREKFASRIGFILISAGCAIGLGNVWRFPYVTGEYGGAAFVLLYLLFLAILGLPILVMEFSVGRASQKSCARSFNILEPKDTKWHLYKWFAIAGNYILMMFYTTVAGWMVAYAFKMGTGQLNGVAPDNTGSVFAALQADPLQMFGWLLLICLIGFGICGMGLQKGVERITKVMMACLFVAILILAVNSLLLPNSGEGIAFYLLPDFSRLFAGDTVAEQMGTFGDAVYAAMGQAFFTLSIGASGMAIFGSYIGRDRRLTGEAISVAGLSTLISLLAGLIIFPACFSFGVSPDSGPNLVFVTLPSVFNQMWLGQLWGTLFFIFMSFAALSTVIGVFENIIAFAMDQWGISRKKAVAINAVAIVILSLPCILGMNVWSGFQIPGIGDIQGLEDFIVSNNILPLGGLLYVLFCTSRYGWGWKNFKAEADAGSGMKFPAWSFFWIKYCIPVLMVIIFIMGYVPKFQIWFG